MATSMVDIPLQHIQDSHELIADGVIELFELTPSGGSGVVRFKSDNDQMYLGELYTGVPMALSGEKKTSDSGLTMPQLTIGEQDIDLSNFKPLIFDGYLDNAVIVKRRVLLNNIITNVDISEVQVYRVKRVISYSRTQIQLQLATLSDSLGFSLPYRQYLPPDFPGVQFE